MTYYQTEHIQYLQQDTIALLWQINLLLAQLSTSNNDSINKYHWEHQIKQKSENVEELKLKIAIVAPMKAGKSTIINAIIGEPLLPSRNSAMTTLPTEIIFKPEIKQPTLILTEQILSVFDETLSKLNEQINQCGIEKISQEIAPYPHLVKLLNSFSTQTFSPITNQVVGVKEINQTLNYLNDIIRLSCLILPESDPLKFIKDIPRIHASLWNSQTPTLGNLVIIDTPGANEAGEHRLKEMMSEQLRKCSMVLIVLDFTQLKTQAAEEVKQEVEKIIELRGKENLYILINKVDQRRRGDLTPLQLQQFVSAEVGISSQRAQQQVFEVSARQAFVAANFIKNIEKEENIFITEATQTLAQEIFGIDWEEELEDATKEQLLHKAQMLWEKSGFNNFIEQAITKLLAKAAPLTINSAINVSNALITKLESEDILVEEKIKNQLTYLSDYLFLLDVWETSHLKIKDLFLAIAPKTNLSLAAITKQTELMLRDFFVQQEYARVTNYQKAWFFFLKLLGKNTYFKPTGVLQFDSPKQGQEFLSYTEGHLAEKIKVYLAKKTEEIINQIVQTNQNFLADIKNEIQEINQPLKDCINEVNVIPKFKINLSIKDILPIDKYIFPELNQEPIKKVKFRPWYFLGMIEKEKKVKVKYSVELSQLLSLSYDSIEGRGEKIKKQIKTYFEQDFKHQLDALFNQMINVLKRN